MGLGFELDGLGVGHAVTQLDGFAAANLSRRGVEVLDGELLSAELFEGNAVLFLLFLGSLLFSALFNAAVFVPAGEKDPADDERGDTESGPGIEEGILERGFGLRIWLSQHVCSHSNDSFPRENSAE